MSVERSVALLCHPGTPARGVRGIDVVVSRARSGLDVRFHLDGALRDLRIPPPGPPRIGIRLWQHTCFEVFVAADGASGYQELNLAPSGEWAGYAFRRYRDAVSTPSDSNPPSIAVRSGGQRLELDAIVGLSTIDPRAALRIGLSAVIEARDGTLSYWALHHPAAKPDFHHPDAFALRLEPADPID